VNHAPLTVAFAGSLHIYHIEPLRALATALAHVQGQLLLVAQRDNPHLTKILLGLDNIEVQAPFRTNPEVLEFLAQRATALIVPYSFDLVLAPNVVTSFPSKLVEFVHLGLPILIFSPPQTALGLWARERKWSLFWSEPNEANLVAMLKHLQNPAQWEKLAAETRVAQAEFDPDHLHQRFEQDLNEVALSWG
jgi:hypothetical protein